jgi:hypothetical protein
MEHLLTWLILKRGSLEEIRDKKKYISLLNNTRAIELGQRHYVLSKRCKHYEYKK